MSIRYPHLFTPLKVGNVTLKNRIMAAPMSIPELTEDYFPTPATVGFYETRAKGGAASVTVGDCVVHRETGMAHAGLQIAFDDPRIARDMARIAQAIKWHDCIPGIELAHGGMFGGVPCLANPAAKGKQSYGPVDFVMENGIVVKAMDEDMMHKIAQAFADAAKRAKMCGFEMIIFHGGHGWMFNQFLSPYTNRRTDKYGGSTENRCRFPILILKAVREAVGPGFPLDFRMSGSELFEGGYGIDEGCRIAEILQDYLDIIHVSVGNHERLETFPRTHPTLFLPHGVNVEFAAEIKKHVIIPVATLGGISDPDMAEEIIASGKADIVCMARALIADPEWPNKARAGQPDEIRRCMRCLSCLSIVPTTHLHRCALNPESAKESSFRVSPFPFKKKKVLVAGGGPGGMQAALTAGRRGHTVILCEASGSLGGQILCERFVPFKDDYFAFSQWLIRQLAKLPNVEVRLNTKVDPELVNILAPDVLLCAIGAEPIVPPIPGIDGENVRFIHDLKKAADPGVGKNVAIIGGGLVGCETAVHFHRLGKNVTIVEMLEDVAIDAPFFHRAGLMPELEKGVRRLTNTKAKEIRPDGLLCAGPDGKELFLPADTVFCAAGMRSRTEELSALRAAVPDCRALGDCTKPGRVLDAVHSAYMIALDL